MRTATGFLLVALLCLTTTPALAGTNHGVQIALDCRSHDAQRSCGVVYASCADIQYAYDGSGEYDLVVVLWDYTGIQGVEYTIDYTGLADAQFGGFVGCGTVDLQWPETGYLTVAQGWQTCQEPPSPHGGIPVGWIHLYGGAGRINLVPSHMSGAIQVVDCSVAPDPIINIHSGFVGGALPGQGDLLPCDDPLGTERTTWGGVKSLYR